jgi:amino acid transporter
MAYISPQDGSSDTSQERKNYNEYQQEVNIADNVEEDDHHHLHRGLKARQITMIAIGGAIGTGLIIGTYVLIFSLVLCKLKGAAG